MCEIIFSDIFIGGIEENFVFEFNVLICVYDILGLYIDFDFKFDVCKGFEKYCEKWIESCGDIEILDLVIL